MSLSHSLLNTIILNLAMPKLAKICPKCSTSVNVKKTICFCFVFLSTCSKTFPGFQFLKVYKHAVYKLVIMLLMFKQVTYHSVNFLSCVSLQ